jgi:hypothetical protein
MLQNGTIGIFEFTPKGPWPFYSKNTRKLPFLAQEAQMILFFTFLHF